MKKGDRLEGVFVFTVAILAAGIYGQQFTTDPCDPKEYKTLDEYRRSAGFLTALPEKPLCDNRLRRGWYRFINRAGGMMPTTCQETNRCGTKIPIYLNGQNPGDTEGIVMRQICANMNNSDPDGEPCCEYSEDIFMKNCGGYYVYYLYPTIDCDMAYCAGDVPPCPVGKWSSTNFPPCKDPYPVLPVPPVVTTSSSQTNGSFGVVCQFVFGEDDVDQRFEVVWTFDGKSEPAVGLQLLRGAERTAYLDAALLKVYLDKNISCQVRSFYVGRETTKSPFISSNATYFGMKTAPVLTGPIMPNNKSFIFQCEVAHDRANDSVAVEVSWTFNNQQDPDIPAQTLRGTSRVAVLDGSFLRGHLNSQIGCQARLVYSGSDIKSLFVSSNTIFTGIQIRPNPLEMSEIDFDKYVTVISTIPVICDDDDDEVDCCLTFKLNINETSVVSLLNSCSYKICSSDWNSATKTASVKVGVVPSRTVLVPGIKGAFLALKTEVPSGRGTYLDIFQGYTPDEAQIIVKVETSFQCSMTGDPHISGFDFDFMYDLYLSGDFIAYVSEKRDFMIQVRTVPCGFWGATCICGIVVKERSDVVKVSRCTNSDPIAGPATIDIAHKLSPGAVVRRSTDGYRFGISLQSGSEVKIESGGVNVYISIPSSDRGTGKGLCGTNDGIKGNDFMHRNGSLSTCPGRCTPNAFFESWRVSGNQSLFEVVPDPSNITEQYCSCLESPDGNSTFSCTARPNVHMSNLACLNCPVISDILKPSYVSGVGWVKPGSDKPEVPFVHPQVKPIDPNKQWPNALGLTETQAKDSCTQAMQKSQLYPRCQNVAKITSSLFADCMADMLYSDTTAFLDGITAAMTTQCQLYLAKNPDNYITNTNGDQVLKPEILDNICPVECFRHGKCGDKGKCLCQDGWEGETCLIETGKGPQLGKIGGGSVCDIQKTCTSIHIDISNTNFMEAHQCRYQPTDEQGNGVGNPFLTSAVFITPTTISCVLPTSGLATQRYNITATKNGVLFGNELPFRIFDSTCLDCDIVGCKPKNTACNINNICYKNGETNKNDGNKTCDITKSTTSWTTRRSTEDHFPLLDTQPIFTGPIIVNKLTVFQCKVVYTLQDPEQVFEVLWTFDGSASPTVPHQLLTSQERIAILDISLVKGLVDKNIGCKVRSYYTSSESSKSQFLASNTTYFGLQIQNSPKLIGPIMPNNSSFFFQCEVVCDSCDGQQIEVVWTFSGQQDPDLGSQNITGSGRVILNGTDLLGHLGTNIGCQARFVFPGSDVVTTFIKSNTYFIGIKVSPDPLEISEIDFQKYVTLISTVPIICGGGDVDCCLTVKLNVSQKSAVSLLNTCDYKICASDWDPHLKTASIQVGVAPSRNVLVEDIRRVSLAFEVTAPTGMNGYFDIFQNYRPNKIQVNVKDETSFTCSLTGDPHIYGFDLNVMLDLFKSGDYIAYVQPERDFMIQVRTVPCGSVACICGIVVREYNDVIKVSKCSNPNPNSGPASVDIAYKLSPGTIVQRSTDGYRFGILLRSGAEITIEAGWINVYISIPASDKGKGRGMCGTNDGIKDNDFTYPDGKVEPPCTSRCIPDAFLESWRVTRNESLFEVVPDPVNITNPVYGQSVQYCSCVDNSSVVTCSERQNVQTANTACPNCRVITDALVPSYVVGLGWVRPGTNKPDEPFVHPQVKPLDTNKKWPNDQGITEAQATDMCLQAVQKSQLYPQCQKFGHLVNSSISDCMADILYGGTTAFLDGITATFTKQCQLYLAKNPDNYITNTNGDQVLKPEILDNICPVECFRHGKCGDKGKCLCQDGWEGETCLIETGKGPQLGNIGGGSLCDIIQKSCGSIHVDVSNINYLDPLRCRIQEFDEKGKTIGSPFMTTAIFLSPASITCSLPSTVKSISRYVVSVTKDGAIFGNGLPYLVFDSTCQDCDIKICTQKNTACHINNVCYKNGEINKNDGNKTCDISKSTSSWTTIRNGSDRVPKVKDQPVLTGPVITANTPASFQCEVVEKFVDPEQVFEVVWTFDGQSDPTIGSHLLFNTERIVDLDISFLKSHIDKYIGCQIRSYYIGYENSKSVSISSNTTYFGVQTPPKLTGPIVVDNSSFTFKCEAIYDSRQHSQEIEAVWTFDGNQDSSVPSQILTGLNTILVLDGKLLTGKLGTKIGCQARLIYTSSDVQTKFIQSVTYYAGIQVSPNPLVMSEVDFEKYVTVTSTIPIICSKQESACCVTIKLNVNQTSVVSLLNSCDYKICSSDWNPQLRLASVQVGVAPARSVLIEDMKRVTLAFDVGVPVGASGYLSIFQKYRLSEIQVSVKDETSFTCSMTGDPHIQGFDKSLYDLFDGGDYIAYVVEERDFMIQIRAVPCGAGAISCICGIVVREQNNVVKIDKCQNSRYMSVEIAYELSPGTIVRRSNDGSRFGIYLPSGSEISIERGGTNVYISIPAYDKGLGRGMCGTNDGRTDNDFTHRNGTVDPPCSGRCNPKAFFKSWRVTGNESLFEVVPAPVTSTNLKFQYSRQYCSCSDSSNGNSTVTCSGREQGKRPNLACPNCPVITDSLIPSYVVGVGWIRPGASKPDQPFVHPETQTQTNTNRQWPNSQGVTEAQARNICQEALEKSPLYSLCQSLGQLKDSLMADCLTDILYGETTAFVDDITSSFTKQCQLLLAQNPDNYITNAQGEQVMKPELLEYVCPVECLKHGKCADKGKCLCQDGWEGETCMTESGKGPELLEISGETVCDKPRLPCSSIHIVVVNVNRMDKLQCRILEVDEHNVTIGAPVITTAIFLSTNTITCTLPTTVHSTYKYSISASKDGAVFGNEVQFRVYDSTCLDCDITGCKDKSTACHINNVCYTQGEADESDANRVCDVTKSIVSWTLKIQPTDAPEPYYPTRPSRGETMKPCHFCYGK